MVARVAHANPSDVIDGEKQALNEYLPMSWDEMGEKYVPFTTDPVTGYAIKDTGSVVDFAKAWLSIGLKHPRAYVQAFISVESGWLAFNGAPANNVEPQVPYPEIALQYQPLTSNALNPTTFGKLMPNVEPSRAQAAVKGAGSRVAGHSNRQRAHVPHGVGADCSRLPAVRVDTPES